MQDSRRTPAGIFVCRIAAGHRRRRYRCRRRPPRRLPGRRARCCGQPFPACTCRHAGSAVLAAADPAAGLPHTAPTWKQAKHLVRLARSLQPISKVKHIVIPEQQGAAPIKKQVALVPSSGALRGLARRCPDMPATVIDCDLAASAPNRKNRIRLALSTAQASAEPSDGATARRRPHGARAPYMPWIRYTAAEAMNTAMAANVAET